VAIAWQGCEGYPPKRLKNRNVYEIETGADLAGLRRKRVIPHQLLVRSSTKVSRQPDRCDGALGNYLSRATIMREAGCRGERCNAPGWVPVSVSAAECTGIGDR
jgi:hypothetical protein